MTQVVKVMYKDGQNQYWAAKCWRVWTDGGKVDTAQLCLYGPDTLEGEDLIASINWDLVERVVRADANECPPGALWEAPLPEGSRIIESLC